MSADQSWFWTASWQTGEEQASAEVCGGDVNTYSDVESFFDALDG